jgi:hypothetical protein
LSLKYSRHLQAHLVLKRQTALRGADPEVETGALHGPLDDLVAMNLIEHGDGHCVGALLRRNVAVAICRGSLRGRQRPVEMCVPILFETERRRFATHRGVIRRQRLECVMTGIKPDYCIAL